MREMASPDTTAPNRDPITGAQVLAWASILLGFGTIQGVIYLRSYWGKFGLDPFQFSSASDLTIVGLTGIGVSVAFMAGAALLGGYLGDRLAHYLPANRITKVLVPLVFVGFLIALAFFVDFGIYLLIGLVLTWSIIALVHASPDIPDSIKKLRFLAYVAVAIAYVPMASYYYGQRKANTVLASENSLQVAALSSVGAAIPKGNQRFVGRLGGEYIFYNVDDETLSIIPSSSVQVISLKRQSK